MLETVTDFLREAWPISLFFQWRDNRAEKGLPQPTPIVPVFASPEALISEDYTYNPDYYASKETTEQIMRRFNGLVMFEKPVQDADRQAPPQWFIRFPEGLEVNAAQLARFFNIYPEDKYPKYAFRFALNFLSMSRAEWLERRREDGREVMGG